MFGSGQSTTVSPAASPVDTSNDHISMTFLLIIPFKLIVSTPDFKIVHFRKFSHFRLNKQFVQTKNCKYFSFQRRYNLPQKPLVYLAPIVSSSKSLFPKLENVPPPKAYLIDRNKTVNFSFQKTTTISGFPF